MKQTKQLAIVSDEELLRVTYDIRKLFEEGVLHDLKQHGHKFIKMEWVHKITPNPHYALMVTYEEKVN